MQLVNASHLSALRAGLAAGRPVSEVLPSTLGGFAVAGGLWRFYSNAWPGRGILWWNSQSPWYLAWRGILKPGMFAFGEDVFGNQLVTLPGVEAVQLLDHETSTLRDLLLSPLELIEAAATSGIDWVDEYPKGALEIAREFGEVPLDSHLHWVVPLFLNGAVDRTNVELVDRDAHHVGHAKLWRQM